MKAELTIEELMADHGFELMAEDDESGRLRYWTRNDGSRVEVMEKVGLPIMIGASIQGGRDGYSLTHTLSTIRLDVLAKLLDWAKEFPR